MKFILGASALLLALHAPIARAQTPPPVDTPYPGTLLLQVDATDLDRRIYRVKESLPVAKPGPLTLLYPRWLPGNHGPTGVIAQLAGLTIKAAGQPVAWRRDPLDAHAFALDVPAGVKTLEIEFQQLTPISGDSGRVVSTPDMLNVQWNAVLLYPAGHFDSRIRIQPTLRLPEGWAFGTALDTQVQRGAVVEFKPVSVETLIDSPLYAARHMTRVDLDPEAAASGRAPIHLNVMAETPTELVITPE